MLAVRSALKNMDLTKHGDQTGFFCFPLFMYMNNFSSGLKIVTAVAPQVAMDVSTDGLGYGLLRSPREATLLREEAQ